MTKPKQPRRTIVVRLPEDLAARLDAWLAAQPATPSRNAAIVDAVTTWLETHDSD